MKSLFNNVKHSELNNLCGIYLIKCKSKIYIGSSKNLYYRLKRHTSNLINNKHANIIMQNCYNKYGDIAFRYTIISLHHIKDLISNEKLWIDYLNPNINIEKDPILKDLSQESRLKISNTLKDKYKKGIIKPHNSRTILVYDLNNKLLKECNSAVDADKYINRPLGHVSKVLKGNKTNKKYIFKYKQTFPDPA